MCVGGGVSLSVCSCSLLVKTQGLEADEDAVGRACDSVGAAGYPEQCVCD